MRLLIVPVIIAAALATGGPSVNLAAAPVKNPTLRFWFGDPSAHVDNPADKIRSDGLGDYEGGVSGITAHIDKADGGRLVIYNGPRSPRKFHMELTDCLAACGELPFVTRLSNGQFLAGVRNFDDSAVPNGLLGMAVGTAGERMARFHMYLGDYNSAFWTLCKSLPNAETFCGVSANSTPARVVRTASHTWTFTATAATGSDVAELIKQTGNNRTKVITTEGSYAVPFTLTVQCVIAADCP